MNSITKNAYAKINLSLDVTGRLENGYHLVHMILQSISLCDVLTFEKIPEGIEITCKGNSELSLGEDNLIYKAVKALQEETGFVGGARITLEKNIPVAAGMAGGSTDCATTLRGINELYALGLSDETLCSIGVRLGADVPFCIMGGTYVATGIGEKLRRIPCNCNPYVLLAKPMEGASTKEVYTALDATFEHADHPDVDAMEQALLAGDYPRLCSLLGNILMPVTESFLPKVEAIRRELVECGADASLMSGSGPTVFGLFETQNKAEEALEAMKRLRPDCFHAVVTFR